jgi:hypothetical protein
MAELTLCLWEEMGLVWPSLMLRVFTCTLDKLLDFDNRENSLHQTPPRYKWNIVESGVKYHNPNPTLCCFVPVLLFVLLNIQEKCLKTSKKIKKIIKYLQYIFYNCYRQEQDFT